MWQCNWGVQLVEPLAATTNIWVQYLCNAFFLASDRWTDGHSSHRKDSHIHCIFSFWFCRMNNACHRCNGCAKPVFPGHWMRQVSAEIIYHLTCFCCRACKRQLSTGEQYGLLSGAVYCLLHYEELLTDPQDRCKENILNLKLSSFFATIWKRDCELR